MTTQTIRQAAEFPALVFAAFFVRNAALITALLLLTFVAFINA